MDTNWWCGLSGGLGDIGGAMAKGKGEVVQ